jgi:hypothetical protein
MTLEKNELFFLKCVKEKVLEKHDLPYQCLSIEFHDDSLYKLYFIMKNFPMEVYLYRYEIIDEIESLIKFYCKLTTNKKIMHMKVYVDYRSPKGNLLNFVI